MVERTITIPTNVRASQTFVNTTTKGDWKHITATKLYAVAGTTIIRIKPVIWASTGYTYFDLNMKQE